MVLKAALIGYKGMANTVALKVIFRWDSVPTNQLSRLYGGEWDVLIDLPPHPNIVHYIHQFTETMPIMVEAFVDSTVVDIVKNRNTKFIIFEYLPLTLSSWLNQNPTIRTDPQLLLRMCKEIASALLFLWQNHIIHRDIKLDNIMLTNDLTVVIVDFGCSIKTHEDYTFPVDINLGVESRHMSFGNISHLAPEVQNLVFQGRNVNYEKQPSWELGVVSFEILCDAKHPYPNYPLKYPPAPQLRVLETEVNFTELRGKYSESIISVIRNLLANLPAERIPIADAKTIIEQEWIKCLQAQTHVTEKPLLTNTN